jgi:sortase (surface protein transpeptidase)
VRLVLARRSTALAVLLAVVGASCVAVALTRQREAPAVPLAAPVVIVPSTPATAPVALPAEPVAAPTELSIPALDVRSSLLTLGQAADGSLAAPPPGPTYDRAGWYRFSPRPGALGPAVIVGHIDSRSGGPSVFFRLGELRSGDTVAITRADGTTAVFAVDDVRRFHKADFPTQLVYGNTDHAALRLITCGGPFDRSTGHYLDNVVVTASLVRAG